MYAFDDMLDLCEQRWKSEMHRKVALALLIGNCRINTKQQLMDFGAKINELSWDQAASLTLEGATRMGIPLN